MVMPREDLSIAMLLFKSRKTIQNMIPHFKEKKTRSSLKASLVLAFGQTQYARAISISTTTLEDFVGTSPTPMTCFPRASPLANCQTQWAYLAGFLDGDGSIMAQIVSRPDYILKYQIRVSVSFIQITKRKHFLIKIQNEIKKGNLRDRGDGISELTLIGWQDVKWILLQMKPFLRIKEKQANLVLKIIEQLPLTKTSPDNFLKICELANQVANLNDSKGRTIITQVVRQRFQDLKLIEEL